MDKLKKTTIALAIIALVLFGVSYLFTDKSYGATIYTTATTDTIGTFRTNVNTSLTNLNNALTTSVPNLIQALYSGTNYYTASTTDTTNLSWYFRNGFLSTASSTLTSSLTLSSLSNGGLGVNNGLVYSGATTTAGTGLTYSGNAFNVNTSQNIATLSNLTSNGFVKTSGGNGTLSIDTTTYSTFSYLFPSNATSTLLSFTGGILVNNATSTITNLVMVNSTSTNATTTTLAITGGAKNCNTTNALTTDSNGVVTCTAQPQGTVTAVSVVSANGFTGSSSGGATPTLTLTTSITGVLKGNGTAISAAANGTDYTLLTATTCSAGQHVSALTASGGVTCSADTGTGTFPFTATTNYGASAVSTSTPVWFTAGMMASTTANYFAGLTIDSGTPQDSWMTMGTTSHEWSLGYKLSDQSFRISSSTTLGTSDALTINKSLGVTLGGALAVTGQTTLATSLTGVLLGTSGVVSNASVQTCTNQFVRAMSASYVATCATVGASDVSLANLSATDSTLTFSGTYTGATARTIGLNLSNPNTWTGLQTMNASTTALTASSFFQLPNGTSQSPTLAGSCGFDTTSGQLKCGDGANTLVYSATSSPSFNIASTTLDAMGNKFNTATSTFLLKNFPDPITLVGFYCKASTTGTALVRFGDGTNWTETGSCSSGALITTATNNTFTAFEDFNVQASSTSGAVSRITVTAVIKQTAQ